MSKLSPVSHKWPQNFLFPVDKIPSNGSELEQRQKLAKIILDICVQLPNIRSRCIYTAIVYMHRFLMIQSSTQYYTLRVCQASIFLACKSEQNTRHIKEIYECTAKVLNTQISDSSNVIDFHKNVICDYEDLLISTLGFGISVSNPHDCIIETIGKIQNCTQPTTTLDKLTKTAHYLAKQSILLTPFCVKYSVDLIAYFCIQLSIEILNVEIKSTDWMNERITKIEIQNLINEFNIIYIKSPDIYKKYANEDEYKVYQILHEKLSILPALITPSGFVPPSSKMDKQKPRASTYFSFSLCPSTEGKTSSINQTSRSSQKVIQADTNTKSEQDNVSTGNKRRYDSRNDDEACKRSSSFLQQRDAK